MMKELHEQGNTIDDIVEVLKRAPILPRVVPPPMGVILERIQITSAAAEEDKRIIYLGHDIVDYCPSLKLKEEDFILPRKNFPMWDLITDNPLLFKAEIHGWNDGEELEKIILRLIKTISVEKNASSISTDYKFPKMSV
ncbi:Inorganic pyrophosphatase 2 [Morus notabilis]|uniref:Inorganic pyrophosphatase 2 n=1 Tax=Morus notabilis TaxID=981085 RepID=W9QMS4_9ROSA|nr:Inorganic pyrophosphatase 2 [Morus notabilis]